MPPFKETKKVEKKPEEKPEERKITTVNKLRCQSVSYIVNPFTQERFMPGEAIDATMDSWLDAQIKEKIIKPC